MKNLIWILLLAAGTTFARPYPSKPVRVLVAFPPGGPVDIIARLIGPKLGDALGQPVVVENKVGASGNIATTEVARSAPDGYTLLTHSSAYAVNPTLYSNAGYDPSKDLVPVAIVASQANIILVNAAFPANTLDELRQKMLAGKLAFGSPGSGTTPHLTAQNLFHVRWKADVTHIPFKGAGPMIPAVLGGEPPIGCMAGSAPMANIKAGKLRALAVTPAKRLDVFPDVPSVGEFLPGYEATGFAGIGAPKATPAAIIDLRNKDLNAGLADPRIKARIEELGGTVVGGTPAEFAKIIADATEKWAKVIRFAGIKAE
jgi:tripartite-type tricarboxylate transporter receptor subunit TctC